MVLKNVFLVISRWWVSLVLTKDFPGTNKKCHDRYMEPSKRIKPLPIVITHNLKHHLHCSVCVRAHAWDLVAHATFMTSTIGRLLTTQQKRQSLSAGVQIPILISHITANDDHRQ